MLKEIHEQPTALRDTLLPLINHQEGEAPSLREDMMPLGADEVRKIEHISILACGTASHAGLIGKAMIEKYARIPGG